jgi:hypothetical protein
MQHGHTRWRLVIRQKLQCTAGKAIFLGFFAEINIYNWQHKDGGWLFRRNPYKKLIVQDKGCYSSRNHHSQLTIQYGGFKSPCRADNAIQILTGSQYRGPPKVYYKISFEIV